MIAKRVDITKNDNHGRLAEYIAAGEEKEKCLVAWCAGCQDNDDYPFAVQEAVLTQAMNVSTDKPKTYHLVLSFRPEDEDKLSVAVFRDMELRFAEALGFSGHQRHCGIHQNTGNIHMHVAYNMIHPETHKRHEPFRDFYALSRVCRMLEKEYGLAVDRGITPGEKTEHIRAKAATVEAQTGQESFESYAVR
ncbi:relaxase/mobilization nuclease domain-containing protein, partial [Desulfovibrio sp. OttesenSCG-928-M14]|nr:relaxase/mobilization nuclease domain-containing protein [Desulfovibrio sp. OttesenSCG-928-M14]